MDVIFFIRLFLFCRKEKLPRPHKSWLFIEKRIYLRRFTDKLHTIANTISNDSKVKLVVVYNKNKKAAEFIDSESKKIHFRIKFKGRHTSSDEVFVATRSRCNFNKFNLLFSDHKPENKNDLTNHIFVFEIL